MSNIYAQTFGLTISFINALNLTLKYINKISNFTLHHYGRWRQKQTRRNCFSILMNKKEANL